MKHLGRRDIEIGCVETSNYGCLFRTEELRLQLAPQVVAASKHQPGMFVLLHEPMDFHTKSLQICPRPVLEVALNTMGPANAGIIRTQARTFGLEPAADFLNLCPVNYKSTGLPMLYHDDAIGSG